MKPTFTAVGGTCTLVPIRITRAPLAGDLLFQTIALSLRQAFRAPRTYLRICYL
jgi:hypothetical protein